VGGCRGEGGKEMVNERKKKAKTKKANSWENTTEAYWDRMGKKKGSQIWKA